MFFDTILQDFRYTVRGFASRPLFALVAVGTIALGVGANTAIFSLVNAALLSAVPGIEDSRGLVEINRRTESGLSDVSYPILRAIADGTEGLESLAGFDLEPVAVAGTGEPQATLSASVTASYFDVLRVQPGMGRFFAEDEATPPTSARLAVISDHLWRTRLGGAPGIVGSTIRVNGTPLTVVGVGAPGFRGHTRVPVDLFVPMAGGIQGLRSAEFLQDPRNGVAEMIGRLAPDASAELVAQAATVAGDRLLQAETGAQSGSFVAEVAPWGPVPATGRGPISAFLTVLMVIVGIILIVACINVAGMLLSRAVGRQGEFAVRRALGAGRTRIVQQLVIESLVLFAAGGAGGVLLAAWLTRLLMRFEPPLPAGFEIALDPAVDARVLLFALAVTVLTALIFNLVPAIRASSADISGELTASHRGGTPRNSRARAILISAQTAGSLTLLVTAGLFVRSLAASERFDPGWETEGIYGVSLDVALIGSDESLGRQQYVEILERVRTVPGVESAALSAKLPLAGRSVLGPVNVPGLEPPAGRAGLDAAFNRVTADYFSTLGIQLLSGRPFGAEDVEGGEQVAIINQRMADVLWPDRSPLGERFYVGPAGSDRSFTVVGVSENTAFAEVGQDPEPFYYLPFSQWYNPQMTLQVRAGAGAASGLPAAIRESIRGVAPSLPLQAVLPLRESLAVFFLPQRLAAWVTGVVGLLGLLLTAVGVYGVAALSVGRRVREIGLRLALGARPADVRARVLGQGMRAPLIGVAIGLTMSALLAQLAARFLGLVSPGDPVVYVAAVLTLLGAASVATWIPASRASRADPADCLRTD